MGFSQENGYIATDVATIMASIMANINTQFNLSPAYTMETFVGTAAYKYFYALAQKVQQGEIKTAEIFQKLQIYIDTINARISRPVTTQPGTIEKIESEGYQTSVKPMILANAGLRHICIDVDDGVHSKGTITITNFANLVDGTDDTITIDGTAFTAQSGAATPGDATFQAATDLASTAESLATQINAHATVSQVVRARAQGAVVYLTAIHGGTDGDSITTTYEQLGTGDGATADQATLAGGEDPEDDYEALRLEICTLISQITVGGVVTVGTETETIVLSNGQGDFDFSYNLPNRLEVHLRLTTVLSDNNQLLVGSPDDVKLQLLENIQDRYRLGRDFEPQRYFSVVDAPWAASVLLEYSLDEGDTWESGIYEAEYDDLFEIDLANITLVET